MGFLVGWIIDRKFIRFEAPANKSIAVFRLVYGVIFIKVIDLLAEIVFAGAHVWTKGFALNFISFFMVTAVYPAAFRFIEQLPKQNQNKKIL